MRIRISKRDIEERGQLKLMSRNLDGMPAFEPINVITDFDRDIHTNVRSVAGCIDSKRNRKKKKCGLSSKLSIIKFFEISMRILYLENRCRFIDKLFFQSI